MVEIKSAQEGIKEVPLAISMRVGGVIRIARGGGRRKRRRKIFKEMAQNFLRPIGAAGTPETIKFQDSMPNSLKKIPVWLRQLELETLHKDLHSNLDKIRLVSPKS